MFDLDSGENHDRAVKSRAPEAYAYALSVCLIKIAGKPRNFFGRLDRRRPEFAVCRKADLTMPVPSIGHW